MRRLLPGLLAFVVLAGLILILPVYSPWQPDPVPVPAKVQEVALGSVSAPAPAADLKTVPTETSATPEQPAEGLAERPALTVRQVDVAQFSMVGVTWTFDPAVTDTVVRVRVQDEAGTWGDWSEVGVEDATQNPDADSGATTRGGTAPLWTGPSTGVEVELVTHSGAQPVDVQLNLIDPGTSPADDALETPEIQDTADAAGMPAVYSRAQWGADERKRTWQPEYASTLRAATVHHTADSNGYTKEQVPGVMRSIYHYHAVSLGWGDIGYNVIVDKFGRLWEGRAGGLASTVIGAHAGGFNTGTFGVSMLGNYDVVDTPAATVEAVSSIIGWKFSLFGIDPRGTTTLTSSGGGTSRYAAGVKVTVPTVFAHRDVGATACPGRYAYARMDQIRAGVAGAVLDMSLIEKRYDSEPALQDLLGEATRPPTAAPDLSGGYVQYENGSLYYSHTTGVRALHGPVESFWKVTGAQQGPLRYPTSDVRATADGKGEYADFQGGTIFWSPETGPRTMMGEIGKFYSNVGGVAGPLGYPTQSVSWLPDKAGQYATFENGTIFWSPDTGPRTMMGEIGEFYAKVGATGGPLGYPTQSVSWLPDRIGQYATFENGTIFWSPGTGPRTMMGEVGEFYELVGAEGGPLGYPTQSVSWLPDKVGQYADFQGGSIFWSPGTGPRTMMGAIGEFYSNVGGVAGPLGYPTQSVSWLPDNVGQYADFQGGTIFWSPDTGPRTMMGEIGEFYGKVGATGGPLGYPTTSVSWLPDKVGQYADFQGGTIFWSPDTGPRTMMGEIGEFYAKVGGASGPLGYPTKSVSWLPDRVGQYATFEGGKIFWSPETGPRTMMGEIGKFYDLVGGVTGPLGYPTQSVSWLPDRVGQVASFQNGKIYWSPTTGPRTVMGPIGTAYAASGAERGELGYPIHSVSWLTDRVGQFALFRNGGIFWSPSTGAHVMPGTFWTTYRSISAERGRLGYPTRDPYAVTGGRRMDFQHGTITVSSATGRATMAYR